MIQREFEGDRLLQKSQNKSLVFPHYRFANLLGLALSWSLLAACIAPPSPKENPPVTTATQSTQDPFRSRYCSENYWKDPNLDPNSSAVIKSVELCFSGGAVLMRLCSTDNDGVYRIIARQMSQQMRSDPGYVLNWPYPASPNKCEVHMPVWDVEPDETDKIMIGQKLSHEPNENTYNVRGYETTRKGNLQNMEVHYLGTEDINPDSIIPRSDSLSHRFQR